MVEQIDIAVAEVEAAVVVEEDIAGIAVVAAVAAAVVAQTSAQIHNLTQFDCPQYCMLRLFGYWDLPWQGTVVRRRQILVGIVPLRCLRW